MDLKDTTVSFYWQNFGSEVIHCIRLYRVTKEMEYEIFDVDILLFLTEMVP